MSGLSTYTEEYCKCVLVVGGVGFVGSSMAEALLKEGRKVVLYDIFNSETTQPQEKKDNAEYLKQTAIAYADKGAHLVVVTGDFGDEEMLTKTIQAEGVTGCVHLGGMVDDRRSVRFPDEYIDVNIKCTTHLLNALGKNGVKMVVQASTRSVFGEVDCNDTKLSEDAPRRPVNPYGATKVAADAMAHCYSMLHNMNVTLIRISSCYGPRGRPDMIPRILVENIHHGITIKKFGDGSATRTWVFISDIIAAFMLALKHPQNGFAEFNTGTNFSTTLNAMIDAAKEVVGKEPVIDYQEVPPGDAKFVGHPDFARIKAVLGWEPQVDVKAGLQKTYDYYLVQLAAKEKEEKEAADKGLASRAPRSRRRSSVVSDLGDFGINELELAEKGPNV